MFQNMKLSEESMEDNVAFVPSHEDVVEIEFLLRRISSMVKKKGREILNNFPITPPQFEALQWLNELGDMTIGDLSNKMYLACSTMTDLVDRMEGTQLVERAKDSKDRRVVRIHLLPKGRKIIENVLDNRKDYLSELLVPLQEDEIKGVKSVLRVLFDRIENRTDI
jgi:DNA-binding MarR family transcriptional regulator